MAKCYQSALPFPRLAGRKIEVEFSGGDITSNGGSPLLLKVDRRLGLSEAAARVLHDSRRQASCQHRLMTLVRQRLHALVLGYEDLNDHQSLRHDAGLQTAASSDAVLASPATLCRWEQTATRPDTIGLHRVLRGGAATAAAAQTLEQRVGQARQQDAELVGSGSATPNSRRPAPTGSDCRCCASAPGWCATRVASASCSAAPSPTRTCSAPSLGASTPPDPGRVLPRHADKQRGLGVVTLQGTEQRPIGAYITP